MNPPPPALAETTHDAVEEEASAMDTTGHPHVSTSTSDNSTTGGSEEHGTSHLPVASIPIPVEQSPGPASSIPGSKTSEEIMVTDQVS
jgi:hypothetical protein